MMSNAHVVATASGDAPSGLPAHHRRRGGHNVVHPGLPNERLLRVRRAPGPRPRVDDRPVRVRAHEPQRDVFTGRRFHARGQRIPGAGAERTGWKNLLDFASASSVLTDASDPRCAAFLSPAASICLPAQWLEEQGLLFPHFGFILGETLARAKEHVLAWDRYHVRFFSFVAPYTSHIADPCTYTPRAEFVRG